LRVRHGLGSLVRVLCVAIHALIYKQSVCQQGQPCK
jgi:hypothetical protein